MFDIHANYFEPHRFYHNAQHIAEMLRMAEHFKDKLTQDEWDTLYYAIRYHDVVYNPMASDNEEKSVELFVKENPQIGEARKQNVSDLIMVTKTLKPTTELERLMLWLDWGIFLQPQQRISEYNYGIFKEFQQYPYIQFKVERAKWFQFAPTKIREALAGSSLITADMYEDVLIGIEMAKNDFINFKPRIGVYAGSFNPFHIGHLGIIQEAEKTFDKVVIVRAINPDKAQSNFPMPTLGREVIQDERGLFIGDIIEEIRSGFEASITLIRGIRNGHDLVAEQSYLQTIKELGCDYPVVQILCKPEHQHISSSMIRSALKVSSKAEEWIVK